VLTPERRQPHAYWLEPTAALMLLSLVVVAHADEPRGPLWLIDAVSCAGAALCYRFPRTGAVLTTAGLATWLLLTHVVPSVGGLGFAVNIFAVWRRRLPWRIPLTIVLTVLGYLVLVERSVASPDERAAPAVAVLVLLVLALGGGELWVRGSRLIELERERAEMERTELRLSLSRDLHDTVAQTLSRAAMGANVLVADPGLPDETRDELHRIADDCRTSAHDLRQMLSALRAGSVSSPTTEPASTESLVHTVADQAARLRAAGFAVETTTVLPHLSAARAQTLSAVTVEAVNNILKHARPGTSCRITFTPDGSDVLARFVNTPHKATRSRRGLGLVGVRERVALLGGSADVERGPDTWTLTVRLPAS
jgi:signal transduction histidine kinase